MAYGILLLRIVAGATMAAHGSQKLFGWFGGGGPEGTASNLAQLRFRAPMLLGLAAGLAELGGGLLLALGLLTPLAALAVVVVMLNAIWTVHRRNGFFNTEGGYEYNLLLLAVAVALAATGGARFSLDDAVGWEDALGGLWWAGGVLALGLLLCAAALTLGRRPPEDRAVSAESAGPGLKRAA